VGIDLGGRNKDSGCDKERGGRGKTRGSNFHKGANPAKRAMLKRKKSVHIR